MAEVLYGCVTGGCRGVVTNEDRIVGGHIRCVFCRTGVPDGFICTQCHIPLEQDLTLCDVCFEHEWGYDEMMKQQFPLKPQRPKPPKRRIRGWWGTSGSPTFDEPTSLAIRLDRNEVHDRNNFIVSMAGEGLKPVDIAAEVGLSVARTIEIIKEWTPR